MKNTIVPKLCTRIDFAVTDKGLVIISFAYSESENKSPIIIESVVIDLEHAKDINNILTGIVERAEKIL